MQMVPPVMTMSTLASGVIPVGTLSNLSNSGDSVYVRMWDCDPVGDRYLAFEM